MKFTQPLYWNDAQKLKIPGIQLTGGTTFFPYLDDVGDEQWPIIEIVQSTNPEDHPSSGAIIFIDDRLYIRYEDAYILNTYFTRLDVVLYFLKNYRCDPDYIEQQLGDDPIVSPDWDLPNTSFEQELLKEMNI